MDKELRKIKKAVNWYVMLLDEHPNVLKDNSKFYIREVENLQKDVDCYIEETSAALQFWCNKSVDVFNLSTGNIFLKFKRYFNMMVVNHYLSNISYELSVYGRLKHNLDILSERLEQYEYLT